MKMDSLLGLLYTSYGNVTDHVQVATPRLNILMAIRCMEWVCVTQLSAPHDYNYYSFFIDNILGPFTAYENIFNIGVFINFLWCNEIISNSLLCVTLPIVKGSWTDGGVLEIAFILVIFQELVASVGSTFF